MATAASSRLGPEKIVIPAATSIPIAPAAANGTQSGAGRLRPSSFSAPITPATMTSPIAHDHTSVVRNRW
jgi:hypothetical protein